MGRFLFGIPLVILKSQADGCSEEYLFLFLSCFKTSDRFIYTRCPQGKLAGAGAGWKIGMKGMRCWCCVGCVGKGMDWLLSMVELEKGAVKEIGDDGRDGNCQ